MKKNEIEKKKRKKIKQRRHDICREAITSGDYAHVRYISPLPRGDGKIHSIKGRVIAQDKLHLYVKRPKSSEVRILKSQLFLMTTTEKKRMPRKLKARKEKVI